MAKYTQEELSELELKAAKYDRYVSKRNKVLFGSACVLTGAAVMALINKPEPKDPHEGFRSNGTEGIVIVNNITNERWPSWTQFNRETGISRTQLDKECELGNYSRE